MAEINSKFPRTGRNTVVERLRRFDQATERQRRRSQVRGEGSWDRGWTREGLCVRGRSR